MRKTVKSKAKRANQKKTKNVEQLRQGTLVQIQKYKYKYTLIT